jgi:hypothetical protein
LRWRRMLNDPLFHWRNSSHWTVVIEDYFSRFIKSLFCCSSSIIFLFSRLFSWFNPDFRIYLRWDYMHWIWWHHDYEIVFVLPSFRNIPWFYVNHRQETKQETC